MPHRGRGLRLFQRKRGWREPKHTTPQSDGARRHQHHILALPLEPRHILRETLQPIAAQLAGGPIDEQRRADFYNDTGAVA